MNAVCNALLDILDEQMQKSMHCDIFCLMIGARSVRVVFDQMCSTEPMKDVLVLMDAAMTTEYATLSGL